MFDCHCHVQFAAFEADSQAVIARAQAAGVCVINVGTQKDTSAKAIEVAQQYERGVYAAIGLHPVHTTKSYHDESELGPADAKAMADKGGWTPNGFMSREEEFDYVYYRKLAAHPKVVAIGECGLDYYRLEAGSKNEEVRIKNRQSEIFLQHMKIAQEVNKPLMIHCRPSKGTDDAYEDLLSIIHNSSFLLPRILHFYVGSPAMTKKFLEAGFNFEFGGVITFTRDYDEQIKMIPLDRILTETDAPYVAPDPYRGTRNEPAYVVEVVKRLAEIKGISFAQAAQATTENAQRIFKISA